jgi:hypothetical protein
MPEERNEVVLCQSGVPYRVPLSKQPKEEGEESSECNEVVGARAGSLIECDAYHPLPIS